MHPDHVPTPEAAAPALTSVQKVHALAGQLGGLELDGPMAALSPVLTIAAPQLLGMLPEDPVELDGLLERLGGLILELRSDPGTVPARA